MNTIVGFSANPEILVSYDPVSTEVKLTAQEFRYNLGGTSANFATALRKLGHNARLLALVGQNEQDVNSSLLNSLLRAAELEFRLLPVRAETSIALLPINGTMERIVGYKPPVLPEFVSVSIGIIHDELLAHQPNFRIATGVDLSEVMLAEALLGCDPGWRVLNPREQLMADPQINRLLARTDLLVCNEAEFLRFFGSGARTIEENLFQQIHELGVELVAVTCNSHGAVVSCRGEILHFQAVKAGKVVSEVGAGDWWLAGLISWLIEQGVLVARAANPPILRDAGSFATMVAGLKVTRIGANNGPNRSEVNAIVRRAVTYV